MTSRAETNRQGLRRDATAPGSRRGWWLLGALVALVLCGPALSASSLRDDLEREVRSGLKVSTALGVHVVDLSSGETVYEFQADRSRIIASNAKLVTTAAAFDILGPGYFFETKVMMRGRRRGGVLEGDLAVVGGGDPNISGRHYGGDSLAIFHNWAEKLEALGIREIEGNVYLVHGLFEPPQVHPDWPRDQLTKWYEAPVEALSFSDNCVLVRVWPGGKPGQPANIQTLPELPLFEVRNLAKTIGSAKRHWVAVSRAGSEQLTVSGSVYRRAAPVESWIAVSDPLAYFGAALSQGFTERGLKIRGEVLPTRSLPVDTWRGVTVHRTDLVTTVEVVNKRSQNFYAESLLKVLGAEQCGEGSWEAGKRVVGEFLERIGITADTYELADGSGMSRNNRFSPRQLTQLLRHMYTHPRGQEFILTLPYSGETDLSWEDRLAEPPYRGNIFAKTGSLNGVSTLTGYAKARSGKVYAFSILFNQTRWNWKAKRSQDEILRALVDNG
ncbi:MAG: D-alanyl-D-alanine carboxypeptidase/D-alanyl-D-alanine-endopeptidase [Acidobacteria bacterium]|nr:MAG: D-alanyl-D-alanine carboxypeptidase/D-alanyl-D-alanine-endopeptidase [Acidobacteriota bacterium]